MIDSYIFYILCIIFGFLINLLLQKLAKISFNKIVEFIPTVNEKINDEKDKLEKSLVKYRNINPIKQIPNDGIDERIIIEKFSNSQTNIKGYKNTGACYINDSCIDKLILQIYNCTIRTNPLHLSLCSDIINAEAEIIRMIANLYNGDDQVVGNVTSGGTDSIRHAIYTARERARSYGIVDNWEIIICTTAHPAFRKAANEYLINVVECQADSNFRLDTTHLKKLINKNTILVVCSCPTFPHGSVDPIESVAKILSNYKYYSYFTIGLHVDCCLGSFVVPFMKKSEYPLYTNFDFSVDGVTSISIDTHKYGYADKGSSVILYKNHNDWRQHQIYVDSKWSGGIYATPTLSGSRSGKDIAGTWATLVYVGYNKYNEYAYKIVLLAKKIKNIISKHSDLKILGSDDLMIVAFKSINPKLNIFNVKNEMTNRGWYLSCLQNPNGIHFCVTAVHIQIDEFEKIFEKDLHDSIDHVRKNPSIQSSDANMYKSNQTIGIKEFVPILSREYWNILNKTN